MAKLNTIEKIVFEVLQESPSARKDDNILQALVCEKMGLSHLQKISYITALVNHNHLNVPNIKTVERSRRKLQKQYPELKDPKIDLKRMKEEEEYRAYAIS